MVQNLFGNPNLRSETPPTAGRIEIQKNLADIRMRDFLARKRKSRELQQFRATGPEMVGEMSWRSRLEGAEEE